MKLFALTIFTFLTLTHSFSQKEICSGDTIYTYKNSLLTTKTYFCDSLKTTKVIKTFDAKGTLETETFMSAIGEKINAKKWYYNADRTYGYQLTDYKKPQAEIIYTEEFYPDGTVKMTSPMLKNEKYGNTRTYYRNQQLQSDYQYKNGQKDGRQIKYYENGQIFSLSTYHNTVIDSIETYYYPSGQIWTEIVNVNGKTMEVKSNFKADGTPLDKGNLYMGTGYRQVYNEYGDWIYMEKYKKGNFKKIIRKRY